MQKKRTQRLRQKTTMTLTGIAKRLTMGAAGSLANLPRDAKNGTYVRVYGTVYEK
jgi:hypothetical protein